ncbi:unnamed protein product [Caenorhabditis sp. 36 PRJEB53466]|nr:unnamed protein product [Caenorhabditis sp. 36 PRJEB53466]
MSRRFDTTIPENVAVLGDKLKFPSGKVAQNRFLKAAMTELLSTYEPSNPKAHGIPTQSLVNVYEKWGNGQFGLILTGNLLVDPNHLEAPGNAIIFQEGDSAARREAYKKLTSASKQDGALVIGQLSHGGRQTPITINKTPFSASDVKLDQQGRFGQPIPLTVEQIKTEVIDRFVYAAKFAYETGFDGVQLHAAHGYLLSQFTSPTTNKRTDQYGGSVENRQRIVHEIYEAVRKEIPASTGFLVGLKTNSVEFQTEGTTVDQAIQMCETYEKAGFDFVELSGGTYEQLAFQHIRESTKKREAFFLEFAEKIRPVFKNTVVYLTGGLRTVNAMVNAVTSGATQGIGLGRPVTAEPDLPKKILKGSVPSAVHDALDQNNFFVTFFGSSAQIEQMSRSSLKEAKNDVAHGISDFSDEATVQRLAGAIGEFMALSTERTKQGIVAPAVLVFD